MINAIPVIGWLISAFFSFSLAVPFYYIWNELAPIYAYWLPAVYLKLPFWHIVGLFMIMPILKGVLVPKLASVEQTVKRKKKVPDNMKELDETLSNVKAASDKLHGVTAMNK